MKIHMHGERLKLRAMDEEDLKILSAYCQDSVLKISDLKYLANENRFIMEMNRFAGEKTTGNNLDDIPERRRAVLHFEAITKVNIKNIDLSNHDHVLNLLAIIFEVKNSPSGTIDLVFSADAVIRLNAEFIEAQLADMNASWAASSKPQHPDS